MDDLISRQAAIDALHMHLMYRMGTDSNKKRLDEWINNLPPAKPQRKKGKWIKHSIGHEHTPWGFDCSECGEWFVVGEEVIKKYNYCPNCGSYNGGNSHEGTDKG